MQQCAKIYVKKCKRAKNRKIDFADVCLFCVPPPSLRVTLDTLNKGACNDYQILIFADSNFCVGKE